jgi:hypothetical protein
LLTVFERKTLATCDHPVHVVPNEDLTQTGRGTGIENAPVIYVPLTRRHSLAMYLPSEVAVNAQLWGWLDEDDRQMLLDARFGPDDLDALLEQ